MVLPDVVLIAPCLIDDHQRIFYELGELDFSPSLVDSQPGLLEFSDDDDIVVVSVSISVAPVAGLNTSLSPNQSSLNRQDRFACSKISLVSRMELWCCINVSNGDS